MSSRVIGNRYLIATTHKAILYLPMNDSTLADGRWEIINSKIFELELSNESALIDTQRLEPLSSITNINSDFLTVQFMKLRRVIVRNSMYEAL